MLPNIDHWRPQIERQLSDALQVSVRLGRINAEWKGLNPRLEALDVRFTDRQGRTLLAVPDARATLSWRSVLSRIPQFTALEARGVDLSLRRDRDARFWIVGHAFSASGPASPAGDAGRMLDWLLSQRRIVLREATLRWTDELRNAPPLVLDGVTLNLANRYLDHRFMLLAEPPAALGQRLDIRGEFLRGGKAGGNPLSLEDGRGQLYAHAGNMQPLAWAPWLDLPQALQSGQLSVRSWLKFDGGRITSLTSDMTVAQGHWASGGGLDLQAQSLRLFLSGSWPEYKSLLRRDSAGPEDAGQTPGQGIEFRLLGQQLDGRAPQVFEHPIALQSITSRGTVQRSSRGWRVGVQNLALAGKELNASLQGDWQEGGSGDAGLIDMQGRIERAAISAINTYMPSMVNEDARNWMAQGLVAGEIADARLTLRGDLEHFPFNDEPDKGDFRLDGRYAGVTIDYLPPEPGALGWPRLDDMRGTVALHRADLRLFAQEAVMRPAPDHVIQLNNVQARIPNIEHGSVLSVTGDTVAEGQAYLKLMTHAPLGKMLDGLFNAASTDGTWRVPLALTIPLLHSRDSTVQGAIHFSGNTLRLAPEAPPLTQVTGRLDFSDTMIAATGLKGAFLGGHLSMEGGVGGQLEGLRMQGAAAASALSDYVGLEGMKRLQGNVPYQARLRRGKDGAFSLDVDSDLKGLAMDFPEPFGKTADQAMPLKVHWGRHTGGKDNVLRIEADNQLRASLLHRANQKGGAYFHAGALGVNQTVALPASGINLDVRLPAVDVDAWDAAVTAFSAVAPKAGKAAKASARPLLPGINQVRLQADTLKVQGLTLDELTFTARQPQAHQWRVDISSSQTAGTLFWREANGKVAGRVDASFDRLALGSVGDDDDSDAFDDSFQFDDDLDIPGINLRVKNFRLYGREVGELSLVGVNQSRGRLWQLEQLNLASPSAELSGSGLWRLSGPDRGLVLDAEARMTDLGAYLEQIGLRDVMKAGQGTVQGRLEWRNMPWDFSKTDLNGHIAFDLEKGRFSTLNSYSARLLELLSLQSVKRLARLDFNPAGLTKDGFPYDNLRGNVTVEKGLLSTSDYRVIGPVGTIVIGGDVDLTSEAIDLQAVVIPNLDVSGAAVAAGIAINPIVGVGAFLTQWLLQAPLAKAMTVEYQIGGKWSDPQIKEASGPSSSAHARDQGEQAQPPKVTP
ncbi:YhdP family protein [Pusillimonas sp. SM2304]|uniref:YhdP family protein n=1 Tax=Pusillimonas sp. SM2304 TaxID=3073241 RepID=UPI002875E89C|nr:YhdP family protein [Pusillimonas sp. SM2304]MDS1141903.1 YhdP family protein [Pusillimonas sp. SM2304]